MDMVFKKKVKKKLKLWRLRESEVKEEFAKRVKSKCDGDEDWCGLKRKMLQVKSVIIWEGPYENVDES